MSIMWHNTYVIDIIYVYDVGRKVHYIIDIVINTYISVYKAVKMYTTSVVT